jgi:dCMP deaminase
MRDSKDTYFIKMLESVCSRSTCLRRSVGAIIVTKEGRTLSMGYNGPPLGFEHCTQEMPCRGAFDKPGDNSHCIAVHAEQNALLQCWRLDLAYSIYITCCPCFTCAKMILQTPIQRVIVAGSYTEKQGEEILTLAHKLFFYDYESLVVRPITVGALAKLRQPTES